MVERAVLPDLRRRSGDTGVIVSRTLRTWGESESGLNERLDPLIARLDETGNPTLAFLASGWEGLKVRLTAKAATAEDAESLLDKWDGEVRVVVGEHVFGVDDETMESVTLLRHCGRGSHARPGRIGHRRPGCRSSHGGARSERRGSRRSGLVRQRGEVRPARRARGPGRQRGGGGDGHGGRRVLGADVGLALTGVAGPTEQDGMPVGTLCVGIDDGEPVVTHTVPPARPARADAADERDHRPRLPPPSSARRRIGWRATPP